eukprot:TRINITY_DN4917_c0_g1_i1.p1 TRINITY_DN4917_c0_g1~~TRINITY_DN4917_c0_g1_i1.p1  ORF type:complete len:464 (-),score=77.92 TRINITY_DN4917_c0_g1_i1:68-1459(-)
MLRRALISRVWGLLELLLAVSALVVEYVVRSVLKLFSLRTYTRGFSHQARVPDIYDYSSTELITSKGYPVEEHYVTTKDGYILTLHRIPHGKLNKQDDDRQEKEKDITTAPPRPVVFLLHGFMQCSEVWICRPKPENNIAFALADLGYDVWLGNVRGNKYSMKHIKRTPFEPRFWAFCLDEIIQYDMPSMLEYVLEWTSVDKLSYIGFSQGTALGFGAFSMNPALAKRVNVFIALASTAKVLPLQNRMLNAVAHTRPEMLFLMFGNKSFLNIVLWWRVHAPRGTFAWMIEFGNKMLFGWDGSRIADSEKSHVYAHLYSQTSVKCVVHWFQIICSRTFQMFDDSYRTSARNVDSYHQNSVPSYPLSRLQSCPVACFYGLRDNMSDIKRLVGALPKNTRYFEEPDYEHLDFLWADNVRTHVFPRIKQLLGTYNPSPLAADWTHDGPEDSLSPETPLYNAKQHQHH